VLATNRDFARGKPGGLPYDTHAAYRYDFWGISGQIARTHERARALFAAIGAGRTRVLVALTFSRLGYLRVAGPVWFASLGRETAARTERTWWSAFLGPGVALLRLVARAAKVTRNTALRPLGRLVRWCAAAAGRLARKYLSLLGRHLTAWSHLTYRWWRARSFEADTSRLFDRISLDDGDLVFVPTLSEVDLAGLGRYLKAHPRSTKASWHLLFRRDIYSGRDSGYGAQDGRLAPLQGSFRQFVNGLRGHRVEFYTDTDRLTTQYDRLACARFRTLPIPVNPAFAEHRSRLRAPDIFTVTYLGDAREEKGYQFLPGIVRETLRLSAGPVRFLVQSNFAFRFPERQGPVVMARHFLRQHPSEEVEVLSSPLTVEEYRNLLLSGSVSLLPYDAESYYARSSGILVESLTAGIPVVVPAGSWLADQIAGPYARYCHSLCLQADGRRTRLGRRVEFGGDGQPAVIDLDVPRGAGYFLVSFDCPRDLRTQRPDLYVLARVSDGESPRSRLEPPAVVSWVWGSGGSVSLLVPVPEGARAVCLKLQNAYGEYSVEVNNVSFEYLTARSGSLPLGAVGLTYHNPADIPRLLAEMHRHYDHYHRTAVAFSRDWIGLHNPDRLVSLLAESAGSPGHSRLEGTDGRHA